MAKKKEAPGEISGQVLEQASTTGELFDTAEVPEVKVSKPKAPKATSTPQFRVLENIWYKGKNQAAGTILNITYEEFTKMNQFLEPI